MNKAQLESFFSTSRLNPYFASYPGNETKAIYLYEANIAISEALYTSVCILEVALRNKINEQLNRKYCQPDWYANWYLHPVMRYAWPDVNNAIRHLYDTKKAVLPDNVVSGLMFGFWTSLFNDRYEKELWASLRFVFPNIPKALRQRKNISAPLNDIRRALRNRIYHNEPVIFNLMALQNHHQNILLLLTWMGADLLAYNNSKDSFPATLTHITTQLATL